MRTYLEPASTAPIPGGSCLASGNLAKINSSRSRVVEGIIELERDSRSSSYIKGFRCSARRNTTGHSARSDGLDRAVSGGLTDCSAGLGASSDEGGPDVWNSVITPIYRQERTLSAYSERKRPVRLERRRREM